MLIDLGEDRSAPVVPPRPRHDRRAWLAGAVVLAALLTLTGSAPPPRPALVPLLHLPYLPSASFAVTPGTVAVLARGVVTGYALPGGTQLWATPVPAEIDRIAYLPGTTTIVALGQQEPSAAGLDYRTGRVLWQRAGGYLASELTDPHLVVVVTPASDTSGEITGIDADTGRTVWSRGMPPGSGALPSWQVGRTAWYGIEDADGGLEVIDEATGALVSRSATALTRYASALPNQPTVSLIGRSLLSLVQDGSGTALVSSDVGTFAPRWRVALRDVPQAIAPCGQLVCLFYPGIVALDPDSGAVRWHTSQWQNVDELSGGLSLLAQFDQGQVRALAIVRQNTLTVLLDLTGWRPIADATAVPLIVNRQSRDLRTWFAAVAPSARGLLSLGSGADIVASACWSEDPYLACPTIHSELRVWRYTPG